MATAVAVLEESGVVTTPTSLELPPDLSYDHYERIGGFLGRLRDATAWWIGDWLAFGANAPYSEKAEQAAEATGRSPRTLTSYLHVAMYVHPSRRRQGLSWTHHRAVSMLPPKEQRSWLKRAEQQRWTSSELKAQIAGPPALTGGPLEVVDMEAAPAPCPECGGQVVYATECLGCGRIEREEQQDG
jgi:hypothetical protein